MRPFEPCTVAHVRRARDPSGRLRLVQDGGVLEAGSPRELALAAAVRIATRHVPEAARRPTAEDLADVGAHDAEAWRLWRRAQHEALMQRWERSNALCQKARVRDPAFPLPILELALHHNDKDAVAERELTEAMQLMSRVPVRPMWRLAATGSQQFATGDFAGASRSSRRPAASSYRPTSGGGPSCASRWRCTSTPRTRSPRQRSSS